MQERITSQNLNSNEILWDKNEDLKAWDHPKGNAWKDGQIFNNKIKYDGHCELNCYLAQKYFRFLLLTFNFFLFFFSFKRNEQLKYTKRKDCYERPSTKHAHTYILRIIQVYKNPDGTVYSCTTAPSSPLPPSPSLILRLFRLILVSSSLSFFPAPFNRLLTVWFHRFFRSYCILCL